MYGDRPYIYSEAFKTPGMVFVPKVSKAELESYQVWETSQGVVRLPEWYLRSNEKRLDIARHYNKIVAYYSEPEPEPSYITKIKEVELNITEVDIKGSLEAERDRILLTPHAADAESLCEKWLADAAFVNDCPDEKCAPAPLGLRPDEVVGPVRKRRRVVRYVPVETLPCESEESEESESEIESECSSDSDSDYVP